VDELVVDDHAGCYLLAPSISWLITLVDHASWQFKLLLCASEMRQ